MEFGERIRLTRYIWGMTIIGMVLGVTFTAAILDEAVLGLVFIMAAAAIAVTGFIWQWGAPFASGASSGEQAGFNEKIKREQIEAVLRRLSDDQLETLRDRISSGTVNDALLSDMLATDEYKRKR
ncbi:MAG: hypothetical protein MUE40_04370 [Anaerolineae bacterium]|nr:hypothetical protein [Anaerolineae bacterium]